MPTPSTGEWLDCLEFGGFLYKPETKPATNAKHQPYTETTANEVLISRNDAIRTFINVNLDDLHLDLVKSGEQEDLYTEASAPAALDISHSPSVVQS